MLLYGSVYLVNGEVLSYVLQMIGQLVCVRVFYLTFLCSAIRECRVIKVTFIFAKAYLTHHIILQLHNDCTYHRDLSSVSISLFLFRGLGLLACDSQSIK